MSTVEDMANLFDSEAPRYALVAIPCHPRCLRTQRRASGGVRVSDTTIAGIAFSFGSAIPTCPSDRQGIDYSWRFQQTDTFYGAAPRHSRSRDAMRSWIDLRLS